ncbi:MAG TPA: hypothetical protein VMN58_11255 [Acidimicrobiales bacterium]|nr:hypothetical protein [Acidimicrobiales bacterium]
MRGDDKAVWADEARAVAHDGRLAEAAARETPVLEVITGLWDELTALAGEPDS